MGQATRTTKLFLTLGKRDQGGANTDKQAALTATVEVLNVARTFYVNFFLAHADKLAERVPYYSEEHLEMRESKRSLILIPGRVGTSPSASEACPLPIGAQ